MIGEIPVEVTNSIDDSGPGLAEADVLRAVAGGAPIGKGLRTESDVSGGLRARKCCSGPRWLCRDGRGGRREIHGFLENSSKF